MTKYILHVNIANEHGAFLKKYNSQHTCRAAPTDYIILDTDISIQRCYTSFGEGALGGVLRDL